ncbi:MAG: helix-turn-helix domain-containing protein [Gemmatimonadales bacterium]
MTRVVVAAASPAVRAGLGALLAAYPGLTVLEAAAAAHPGALAELAEIVEADVVLLALEPGEALPLPLALAPDAAGREPAVVVLGDEPAESWAFRALRAGARGALPRTASGDQIAAAVMAAAAGLAVLPAEPAAALPQLTARTRVPPIQPLTARETEVLAMLAEGIGNKLIAGRLGISEHTVKTHVAAIFGKLGVSTRAEAVASAARLGLIML